LWLTIAGNFKVKLHNPVIIGVGVQAQAPVNPTELVRKFDLDAVEATSGGTAPIFITAVTPSGAGNTGLPTYEANTVPANKVLTDIAADTGNLRIHFLAEASTSEYSPTIQFEGVDADSMSEVSGDVRLFEGYHDVVLTEDGSVTLTHSSGQSATVDIDLQIGGPAISSLTIGTLPNSQTEIKSGDTVPVTGVVENSATSISVLNTGVASSGSLSLGADDSGGTGLKTITGNVTVSSRTGVHTVDITASNVLGTIGSTYNSDNTATLNQTYPTIGARTINYVAGHEAIKNGQAITIDSTITDFDTVAYSFERGTVDSNAVYGASKTVNANEAVYDTNSVYGIVATKTSNGAVTSANTAVYSAGVTASLSISVTGSPARLQTSPTGNDYQIVISSNQTIHTTEAPTLIASNGTWQGSWVKSGNTWRRDLRFTDGDPVGAGTFSGLSLMNAALIETTSINSGADYTVGGFTQRTIVVPAFAQEVDLSTIVGDATNVRAYYGGTLDLLLFRTDTANAAASFTITNGSGVYTAVGGTYFWISDAAFAGSNTSGTLEIDVEEIA
jgi:hypothetical protein